MANKVVPSKKSWFILGTFFFFFFSDPMDVILFYFFFFLAVKEAQVEVVTCRKVSRTWRTKAGKGHWPSFVGSVAASFDAVGPFFPFGIGEEMRGDPALKILPFARPQFALFIPNKPNNIWTKTSSLVYKKRWYTTQRGSDSTNLIKEIRSDSASSLKKGVLFKVISCSSSPFSDN